MTLEDCYVHAVVNRHRCENGSRPAQLDRLLRAWGGRHLESITLAGSRAKGTALRGSDLDLFLSLSPETPGPLEAIHTSLARRLHAYSPQPRNVSVRVLVEGVSIDLVPARRREDSTVHTLWQLRHNTWLQTDIQRQIQHIQSSGLTNEILALKIWTREHALRFPSFALELTVIQALQPSTEIAKSFLELLEYLAKDFPQARLLDPANTNNIVSESLTPEQKHQIATAASQSRKSQTWPEIL